MAYGLQLIPLRLERENLTKIDGCSIGDRWFGDDITWCPSGNNAETRAGRAHRDPARAAAHSRCWCCRRWKISHSSLFSCLHNLSKIYIP